MFLAVCFVFKRTGCHCLLGSKSEAVSELQCVCAVQWV